MDIDLPNPQNLSLARVLVGIVCIPNVVAAALLVGSPALLLVLSVVVDTGFSFFFLVIFPVIILFSPGIWLAYGYTSVFLQGRPPFLPWPLFWGLSTVANAALFAVSTYSWIKWVYPGKPIFPFIDPLLIWLPLDGALFCLWQLTVCILSIVIAWRGSDVES